MATERCPQCGHTVRDGECTDENCGYVLPTTLRVVKPAVDRPHQPSHATAPTHRQDRTPPGPPSERERQVGLPWVERCRQTLAEHQPRPDSPTVSHVREVANGLGRPTAVKVAGELLEELTAPHGTADVETGGRL